MCIDLKFMRITRTWFKERAGKGGAPTTQRTQACGAGGESRHKTSATIKGLRGSTRRSQGLTLLARFVVVVCFVFSQES